MKTVVRSNKLSNELMWARKCVWAVDIECVESSFRIFTLSLIIYTHTHTHAPTGHAFLHCVLGLGAACTGLSNRLWHLMSLEEAVNF